MSIFKGNAFRPTSNTPLYEELYAHMRAAILSGELKDGMKLPSTRALAEELNVSRNTVLNAYRQLLAEGYLESREGSGTFVARILPELLLTAPRPTAPEPAQPHRAESPRPVFSEHAKAQIAVSQPPTGGKPRPFLAEAPALDVFPYQLWSRLVVRHAAGAVAGGSKEPFRGITGGEWRRALWGRSASQKLYKIALIGTFFGYFFYLFSTRRGIYSGISNQGFVAKFLVE